MNDPDFQDWLNRHRAAFPSLNGDLERLSKNGTAVKEVIRTWRAVLGDVALGDAVEATARLARGDDEPPRRIDDHARVVRAVSKRIAGARLRDDKRRPQKLIDGEPVYDCHFCSDTGMRTVWHSSSVKAMYVGKYVEAGNRGCTERTAAVKCGCQRGQLIRTEGMETFSDGRHLEYEPRDLERVKRLHDFAHRGPVAVPFDPSDYGEQAWNES